MELMARMLVLGLTLVVTFSLSGTWECFAESGSKSGGGTNARTPRTKKRAGKTAKHAPLTEKDALRIISSRPEVKRWKSDVTSPAAKARGVEAIIEIDRKEGASYVVHVYELVPDDAENSHTATFNWYYVNEKSGAVTKDF